MNNKNNKSSSLLEELSKKYNRAIVTGGAGFIGSHICEELVKTDIEVISIDNFVAGKEKNISQLLDLNNFSSVKCDITDTESISQYLEGVDIIFHNAAAKKNVSMEDPARDLEVNTFGTYNLLELSRKAGVKKFIHASTGSVYGEPIFFPQDESHPLNPVSHYGVSKLAGEKYVSLFNKLFGIDTTVLRYYHVYGTRQESNEFGGVVSIFIRNLLNREAPIIFGDGTQERSFTFVKDLVHINLMAAINPLMTGESYNCASGISVNINDLCSMIIDFFGMTGKVEPKYEDWLIGDIKKFDVSSKKITDLGMRFERDFPSKLKETIDDMKIYLASKSD